MKTNTYSKLLSRFCVALVALLSLANATTGSAQGYAGHVNRYTASSFSATFTTIVGAGGTTSLGTGYNVAYNAAIPLPFAFSFDSTLYPAGAKLSVSTNSDINFNSSIDPTTYNMISNHATANGFPSTICVYSTDCMMNAANAGIYYATSGSPGSRVLTIEFYLIHGYSGAVAVNTTSFQVKLYEGSNNIEFLYKNLNSQFPTDATIGIGLIGSGPSPIPWFPYDTLVKSSTPANHIRFTCPPLPSPNIQLSLSPKTLNYGSVNVGSYSEQTITANNAGTAGPLTLGTASISGPNASEFIIQSGPSPSGSLTSGQSATYIVRYTPQGGTSSSATFTLMSNGRDSGTQLVSLSGSGNSGPAVYPVIDVLPTPAVLFKNKRVSMSDSLEQFVVIRSTATDPLTINSYVFSGDGASSYSVSRPTVYPIPGGTSDTLRIMFTPHGEGFLPAVLTINNNSTNNPSAQVQLKGIGTVARFVASPDRVQFDSVVALGSSKTATFSLYNPGSDTLRIKKQYFTSQDGDFTFTPLKGKDTAIAPLKSSQPIVITFTPMQVGTRQARLRFLTNIPLTYQTPRQDTGFIEVEIRGNDVVLGKLFTIANAKDTIKVKTEICRADTLWNTGFADVLVKSAVLSGPNKAAFMLSGFTLPFTIKPNEYATYTICTTPQAIGITKAILTFSGTSIDKVLTSVTNYTVQSLAQKSQFAPPVLFNGISILKDTKRTQTLTLTNIDEVATTYYATILKGAEYTIEADPVFTLWPGMSKTIAVTFAPTSKGVKNGTLRISADQQADVIIPMNGSGQEVSSAVAQTEACGYLLEQNYPNPTTSSTSFNFSVPSSTNVRIILADVTGNVIRELANGRFDAGNHQVSVSTREITSGTYLYILESNAVRLVRQMVIAK